MTALLLAAAAAAIWLYLLLGRGFFWLGAERDDTLLPKRNSGPDRLPAVTAIVPARNEAEVIARNIGSLLRQNYPGRLRVVLVDDESTDGTAEVARDAAAGGRRRRSPDRAAGLRPAAPAGPASSWR